MTVELTDELVWIEECYDLGDRHKHVSVYVIRGEDAAILVDSGSFHDREAIAAGVESAVGDRSLDALILSHSDYPHAGNVREFAATDDATELVASSGAPTKQGLPDATKADIGGSMTVAGRDFSFIDPPLADRSHTTWIFDYGSGGLFTADGFGSRHDPGQCSMTSADFLDGVSPAAIEEYHRHELVWLRYVDPERLRDALTDIVERYPVSWVAPIHGHPIAESDLDQYIERLVDAARQISDAEH